METLANQPTFLAIDDDYLNNKICQILITKAVINADVKTFTVPEDGLKFIASGYDGSSPKLTILLLDINMPTMTGWEFLAEFEKFDPIIKNCFKIYILSSSIDERDMERAKLNKNVVGYIQKPLRTDKILNIIEQTYTQ